VRNGKAFLFSGLSRGRQDYNCARLAPHDATLLTDEASYVRRLNDQYLAYGTPFAGELGRNLGRRFSTHRRSVICWQKSPENGLRG